MNHPKRDSGDTGIRVPRTRGDEPLFLLLLSLVLRVPRTRGDEGVQEAISADAGACSPHTRG